MLCLLQVKSSNDGVEDIQMNTMAISFIIYTKASNVNKLQKTRKYSLIYNHSHLFFEKFSEECSSILVYILFQKLYTETHSFKPIFPVWGLQKNQRFIFKSIFER